MEPLQPAVKVPESTLAALRALPVALAVAREMPKMATQAQVRRQLANYYRDD